MNDKEIHIRDYFRIINKRRNTVITFFIITLTTVVIATFTATPIYRATTNVLLEKNTSSPFSAADSYTRYESEFMVTQYQIIKSAAVAQKVVSSFDVEKIYNHFFPENLKTESFLNSASAFLKNQYSQLKKTIGIERLLSSGNDTATDDTLPKPLSKSDKLKQAIQSGIIVEPIKNSRVVAISFTSDNPALAMKVTNSIAQAYIDELLDMRMEIAGYSIKWMTKKAELEKKKLEESENALHRYQKEHNIITIEDRITVIPERLSELSRLLTAAETRKKELGSIYYQIKKSRKDALETIPAISENKSIDAIKRQIITAEQKISELSKKYGKKHPVMVSAKDDLTILNQKKGREIQKAVQTIRNEYQLAQSNESDLKNLLNDTKFEAANLNEKYIQLKILKREVETNRYLYDALVKKMKEKGITEEKQTINVWVLEKAVIPKYPSSPNKKLNLLLAVFLGIFGGIGLVFFFEYLDNTVKSPEDIEEKFDVPVIGTIGVNPDKKGTLIQTIVKDSSSLLSENFKTLRTSVFLSSADKHPKTLLVTSTSPGEGKSSVSSCLALTIAKTGKKTLLIDGDMRRPVQHHNFDLDNSSGLSSFLAGVTSKNLIKKAVMENLDIINAGPVPPNPSELLSSEKLGKMITKLADIYDMIIIDSPPVISVSDPLIISRNVEGAVIVALAGSTTHELLNKGLKQFNEKSTPVTGIVINMFDAKKSGYYYGYGEYYYSSSSSES